MNMIWGLLQEAYENKASDLHFEPRRDKVMVRFRVDGVLYERLSLSSAWARPCVARLKVLAQLDLAQSRLPQDGRAQAMINNRQVDLRIATSPTIFGESAVIRLLDGGREIRSIRSLDMDVQQIGYLKKMIKEGEGFILATGPTGSGKTTTLYAVLQEMKSSSRKVITLEDPVENQLDGITQINVHSKIGLDFAKGFRSILRQDPDIVLVGEIRDEETAKIAVQASLTGHMVLSTLHTVGTAEAVSRLQDMGVDAYLLGDTLRGIIAQRLVRRICNNCRKPADIDPDTRAKMGVDEKVVFYEGAGCDQCYRSGYRGRLAVYEVMLMTADLCDVVRQGKGTDLIRRHALDAGAHSQAGRCQQGSAGGNNRI